MTSRKRRRVPPPPGFLFLLTGYNAPILLRWLVLYGTRAILQGTDGGDDGKPDIYFTMELMGQDLHTLLSTHRFNADQIQFYSYVRTCSTNCYTCRMQDISHTHTPLRVYTTCMLTNFATAVPPLAATAADASVPLEHAANVITATVTAATKSSAALNTFTRRV